MKQEQIVLAFDIIYRRWWLFLLPLALAIPLAALIVYKAPTKYIANSIILLDSANRGDAFGGSGSRPPPQSAYEQIQVIDAWLKSDHVLASLLPQLNNDIDLSDPKKLFIEMTKLRAALNLNLVGNSVLNISLESRTQKGLGKKLEIIVSQLMEGLMRPDAGILNASQLVLLHRKETASENHQALRHAIKTAGLSPTSRIESQLKDLYYIEQHRLSQTAANPRASRITSSSGSTRTPESKNASTSRKKAKKKKKQSPQTEEEIRLSISRDPALVQKLEQLFAAYEEARIAYEVLKENTQSSNTNFVTIFSAPEKLTIIGRPQDPLVGGNSGLKLAIAGLFLSILTGAALVFLAEYFDTRMRARQEFETLSGLPIVARLSEVPTST